MDLTDFRPPTDHARINQFGIRCFRDTGDDDYIAARLAMRARLAGPFLWSAEQAVEKYLKCILMLNRRPTNGLSHKIGPALDRINNSLPFRIKLRKGEQAIFDHLAEWDADRYLLGSFVLRDIEVLQLDRLAWKLRGYCQPLDVVHYADPPCEKVLMENVRRIEANLDGEPKSGYLEGGKLERILQDRNHPAHGPLVWKNLMYSLSKRNSVKFRSGFQAVNSPLWLNPELAQEAAKWMYIPPRIVSAANDLAKKRDQEKPQ
jgi:hypothetical protein